MKPSDFKNLNLDNLLGKVEMEQATRTIINMAIEQGDDFERCPVNVFSFDNDNEKHGFCFLLYGGWMEEDGSGNNFVVGKSLVEALTCRNMGRTRSGNHLHIMCPGDNVDEPCGGDLEQTEFIGMLKCPECGDLFTVNRIEPGEKLYLSRMESYI